MKDQPAIFLPLHFMELDAGGIFKSLLMTVPVLVLLHSGGHLKLDPDAYNVEFSYFLLQKQEVKTTTLIDYWSRTLTDAERRNSTAQPKRLATL